MGRLEVDTPFGTLLLEYEGAGLTALHLPGDLPAGAGDEPGEGIVMAKRAGELLRRYFSGGRVDFSDVPVHLPVRSPFFRAVEEKVRLIPYGEVLSYRAVAGLVNRPGASRAVGRVMATNPLPIIIPCHRVVAADGRLTGYSGAGGLDLKARLLLMEGVAMREGRIVMSAGLK